MSSLRDPVGTEQIELMFAEDLNFFVNKEVDGTHHKNNRS